MISFTLKKFQASKQSQHSASESLKRLNSRIIFSDRGLYTGHRQVLYAATPTAHAG